MPTLELVLKYRWFCLILAGIKRNEYRKLTPYWKKRLLNDDGTPKPFRYVRFRWAYAEGAPEMTVSCHGIIIDHKRKRFDIQLGGTVLSGSNLEAIGQPTPEDIAAHEQVKNGTSGY